MKFDLKVNQVISAKRLLRITPTLWFLVQSVEASIISQSPAPLANFTCYNQTKAVWTLSKLSLFYCTILLYSKLFWEDYSIPPRYTIFHPLYQARLLLFLEYCVWLSQWIVWRFPSQEVTGSILTVTSRSVSGTTGILKYSQLTRLKSIRKNK